MYGRGAVGANSGEKVWIFDTVYNVVQLLAVAGEKYATRPWAVTAADDIALHELGRIGSLVEWLVEAFGTIGKVSSGMSMKAWHVIVSTPAQSSDGEGQPMRAYLVA